MQRDNYTCENQLSGCFSCLDHRDSKIHVEYDGLFYFVSWTKSMQRN